MRHFLSTYPSTAAVSCRRFVAARAIPEIGYSAGIREIPVTHCIVSHATSGGNSMEAAVMREPADFTTYRPTHSKRIQTQLAMRLSLPEHGFKMCWIV